MAERASQQRPTDTIADRIGLIGAGNGQHFIQRVKDAFLDVIVPGVVLGHLVGRPPGNDEDAEALVRQPPDQRVLLAQIHDVVFVDPWREDEQRALINFLGRRLELEQLDQLVAEDDLAGRRRDILADLERRLVRLADGQAAIALGDIGACIAQPINKALPAGLQHGAQGRRVGRKEIGWRQRVDGLAGIELRLALV